MTGSLLPKFVITSDRSVAHLQTRPLEAQILVSTASLSNAILAINFTCLASTFPVDSSLFRFLRIKGLPAVVLRHATPIHHSVACIFFEPNFVIAPTRMADVFPLFIGFLFSHSAFLTLALVIIPALFHLLN